MNFLKTWNVSHFFIVNISKNGKFNRFVSYIFRRNCQKIKCISKIEEILYRIVKCISSWDAISLNMNWHFVQLELAFHNFGNASLFWVSCHLYMRCISYFSWNSYNYTVKADLAIGRYYSVGVVSETGLFWAV